MYADKNGRQGTEKQAKEIMSESEWGDNNTAFFDITQLQDFRGLTEEQLNEKFYGDEDFVVSPRVNGREEVKVKLNCLLITYTPGGKDSCGFNIKLIDSRNRKLEELFSCELDRRPSMRSADIIPIDTGAYNPAATIIVSDQRELDESIKIAANKVKKCLVDIACDNCRQPNSKELDLFRAHLRETFAYFSRVDVFNLEKAKINVVLHNNLNTNEDNNEEKGIFIAGLTQEDIDGLKLVHKITELENYNTKELNDLINQFGDQYSPEKSKIFINKVKIFAQLDRTVKQSLTGYAKFINDILDQNKPCLTKKAVRRLNTYAESLKMTENEHETLLIRLRILYHQSLCGNVQGVVFDREFKNAPPESNAGYISMCSGYGSVFKMVEQTSELFSLYGDSLGWKFHIAINDDVDEDGCRSNLDEGWRIVCEVLTANNVFCFKVIAKGLEKELRNEQANKQITIYSNLNKEKSTKDWDRILNEIERRLMENGIKPKLLQLGVEDADQAIKGSKFITYRNDLDEGRQYVPASKALYMAKKNPKIKAYNIGEYEDIFKDIKIQCWAPQVKAVDENVNNDPDNLQDESKLFFK